MYFRWCTTHRGWLFVSYCCYWNRLNHISQAGAKTRAPYMVTMNELRELLLLLLHLPCLGELIKALASMIQSLPWRLSCLVGHLSVFARVTGQTWQSSLTSGTQYPVSLLWTAQTVPLPSTSALRALLPQEAAPPAQTSCASHTCFSESLGICYQNV